MSVKRNVPSPVKSILDVDVTLTSAICNTVSKFLPTRKCSTYYKGLEVSITSFYEKKPKEDPVESSANDGLCGYSCHGIVWLAGWLIFIWFAWTQSLFQMQVNFFIGLLIDIFAVAIIKAFVRRRRPMGHKNDQWVTIGPDVYSFPSGHVSRAFFIMFFFCKLYLLNEIMVLLLCIWAFAVAFSRILLRRHHLLDVIAGGILGYLVLLAVSVIWVDQSTAEYIVSYVSDDKLEGGEYHV